MKNIVKYLFALITLLFIGCENEDLYDFQIEPQVVVVEKVVEVATGDEYSFTVNESAECAYGGFVFEVFKNGELFSSDQTCYDPVVDTFVVNKIIDIEISEILGQRYNRDTKEYEEGIVAYQITYFWDNNADGLLNDGDVVKKVITLNNPSDAKDGVDGNNGQDGKDGQDGKNGENGENGKDAPVMTMSVSFVEVGNDVCASLRQIVIDYYIDGVFDHASTDCFPFYGVPRNYSVAVVSPTNADSTGTEYITYYDMDNDQVHDQGEDFTSFIVWNGFRGYATLITYNNIKDEYDNIIGEERITFIDKNYSDSLELDSEDKILNIKRTLDEGFEIEEFDSTEFCPAGYVVIRHLVGGEVVDSISYCKPEDGNDGLNGETPIITMVTEDNCITFTFTYPISGITTQETFCIPVLDVTVVEVDSLCADIIFFYDVDEIEGYSVGDDVRATRSVCDGVGEVGPIGPSGLTPAVRFVQDDFCEAIEVYYVEMPDSVIFSYERCKNSYQESYGCDNGHSYDHRDRGWGGMILGFASVHGGEGVWWNDGTVWAPYIPSAIDLATLTMKLGSQHEWTLELVGEKEDGTIVVLETFTVPAKPNFKHDLSCYDSYTFTYDQASFDHKGLVRIGWTADELTESNTAEEKLYMDEFSFEYYSFSKVDIQF